MKKEQIFVAIPTMSGEAHIGLFRLLSVLDKATVDPDNPYSFSWQVINGKRPVEYARNVLSGIFLKRTEADRLWFLDYDMIPGDDFPELLKVDADIVGARAWAFNHGDPSIKQPPGLKLCVFHYNLSDNYRFNPVTPEPGAGEVDCTAVGAATMIIKRRVLEDRRMWLDSTYKGFDGKIHDCLEENENGLWAPPIWRTLYRPNGHILRGEDLDFCLRAKNLGYQVKGHVGVPVGHQKPIDINEVANLCDLVGRRVRAQTLKELGICQRKSSGVSTPTAGESPAPAKQ